MTTMLDKVAVVGDITQALDRRGVWTVAITVIGGTESTAVKLQSCETADGSFTDFKELIPASDATADQYKGFVVDLHGAGKFIKVVGATMATAVFGDCDYDVKQVAIKAGEIPSGADLEDNKTATINVSIYTEPIEIEPTDGKDGMKKATVTLSNIPSGGSITLYAWKESSSNLYIYTNFSIAPNNIASTDANKCLFSNRDDNDSFIKKSLYDFLNIQYGNSYNKESDTSFYTEDTEYLETNATYTRDSTKDVIIW